MDKRWFRIFLCTALALALSACGFHLRRGAKLPPGMQRIHLDVSGGGDLPRELAQALRSAGATLVDEKGSGVAEFNVPVARFRTDALTFTGHARVGEYSVRYETVIDVRDSKGNVIVPRQNIQLSREFTYDARQPVGTATQTEEIHRSMVHNMVQSIEFRLRAVAEHPVAAAAAASSSTAAPAPAAASSSGGVEAGG